MFLRSVSRVAAFVAVVALPVACGSFSADEPPSTEPAEGGGAGEAAAEGGTVSESGAGADSQVPEGGPSPAPVVLSMGHVDLRAVAATETDVFFVDQSAGGGVFTVPIKGGVTRPLANGGAPSSVAVQDGYVYWTDASTRTVNRTPMAGGAINSSVPVPTDRLPPSIVVAATGAIIALIGSATNTGEILQYAPDLSPVGSNSSALTSPFSLTAVGPLIFWTEGGPGIVAKSQVNSTTRTPLFTEGDPQSITADPAGVYWTIPSQGKIRASLGGATPITIASGETQPRSIAADSTYVYWTTSNNELRRAGHLDNGTSSPFAKDFMALTDVHARAIAVTSMYVVWLTADGMVLRASSQ